MSNRWLNLFSVCLVVGAAALLAYGNYDHDQSPRLLNVSYDPTRELYAELNPKFVASYRAATGRPLQIEQSHGGSSKQARAVSDGLAADVVTLALPSDIEGLVRKGLIAKDWRQRLPHDAQPYSSTIVFVVRKTNPRHIEDWPDLIGPGVIVVTPDPETSGNGKLSVLAAWGAVTTRGGSEEEARAFLRQLYGQHVSGLGQGARDATTTFALAKEGDVHLTWENEAIREVQQSGGELEVIYPPVSIRAEPSVAWVDANVAKHGSAAAAKAYLEYLFTDEAQELFAKDGYWPSNETVLRRHRDRLPDIRLFPVTLVAKDWDDAQTKFFGDDGIFSLIRPAKVP